MIYLDSSALVKLALTEPESAALARWLAERADQPLVSSALHRAEVPRAVWRAEPGALPRSYRVIRRIARIALTADVLDTSATLPPQELSPARAIHLASALALKRDLTAFVAYDEVLLAGAKDAGLPVASPGVAERIDLRPLYCGTTSRPQFVTQFRRRPRLHDQAADVGGTAKFAAGRTH